MLRGAARASAHGRDWLIGWLTLRERKKGKKGKKKEKRLAEEPPVPLGKGQGGVLASI